MEDQVKNELHHSIVSEDDDNEDCDLDEQELFQFTQACSQHDDFGEDDDDDTAAPAPTDYSQHFDDEEAPDDDEEATKRPWKRQRPCDSFHDTSEKYFLQVKNECLIFKKGEFFTKHAFLGEPDVVYRIDQLYIEKKKLIKKAKCKVYKLIRNTFLGQDRTKALERKYGKYVVYRESQNVALFELKKPLEKDSLRRFLLEEQKTKIFMEPPPRDAKGVGWTVAYGFLDSEHGMKCPCSTPTFTDYFAGGGGMSLGLTKAGFQAKILVEIDPHACSTLKVNHPGAEVFQQDVELHEVERQQNRDRPPFNVKTDHLHASSPCQGFSRANRTGGVNDEKNNEKCLVWPLAIVDNNYNTGSYENVTGMLQEKHLHYLKTMMAILLNGMYQVRLGVINCAHYGDPQNRERVIMLASRKPWPLPELPEPTHGEAPLLRLVTAKDVLQDLEKIEPRSDPGMTVLPNGLLVNDHDLSSESLSEERLIADKPAATIRCKNPVRHYSLDRNITCFERKRFQNFPDVWYFSGKPADVMKQIGNAVPVGTSTAIGRAILERCYEASGDFFSSSEEQTVCSLPKPKRNARRVTESPEALRAARNL